MGKGSRKSNPLNRFVRPRGQYVVNQKAPIHADRRGKRNRDRASRKRHAVEDQTE